ncbi:GTPase family protein [Roseivivax marinus]|uniref:GTPase family protein n=1 Tax=Roseivivax marinus TaxID=1379903 RepID=UPI00273F197C|nr:GTPase [Roseivivax marinus]
MIVDRLRGALLRWRIILRLVAIGLPFLAGFALGMLWLYERGQLLAFMLVCAAIGLVTYIALSVPVWLHRKSAASQDATPSDRHVDANPDWSASERAAFAAARDLIDRRLEAPLPGSGIQAFALEVVRTVARASGETGRSEYDFTVPEALLLVERVASRLRGDLRSYLSISDRVSVGTLLWLWRNQGRTRMLYGVGRGAYRVFRMVTNPPRGIAQELNDLVTSGNSNLLTAELQITGQRILFEEIASAATELYSGRLRMSDAELLDSILRDADLDRARLAAPDAPLRIAVAGQVSAGKSSLVNALLGREAAETDLPPTTDRETAHEGEIHGMPCRLIDLPGLDGSRAAKEATLAEADNCDILIWVLPATRPGREIDRATLAEIRTRFAAVPDRRPPPVIGVASFCDRLAGSDWPYPEHALPEDVQVRIGDAVRVIARDLDLDAPVPVAMGPTEWNVGAVHQQLEASFFEGVTVQRNRARLARGEKSAGREALDTVHGASKGLLAVGRHAAARYRRAFRT